MNFRGCFGCCLWAATTVVAIVLRRNITIRIKPKWVIHLIPSSPQFKMNSPVWSRFIATLKEKMNGSSTASFPPPQKTYKTTTTTATEVNQEPTEAQASSPPLCVISLLYVRIYSYLSWIYDEWNDGITFMVAKGENGGAEGGGRLIRIWYSNEWWTEEKGGE